MRWLEEGAQHVPFSILISARLPLLTLRASAMAFGMRTARLFPNLAKFNDHDASPQSRDNVYRMQLPTLQGIVFAFW
jgi:hypothetical protein